jgi:magnesium-transporting ATPase (P-type)
VATTSRAGERTQRGLTSEEVTRRRDRDGPNLLPEPRRPSLVRQLAAQLTHLLAVLLWLAAGMALLAGMPELAVAIVVIILLNGLFAFWQEYRADRSTQELRALLPSAARVVRDGAVHSVDAADLVVDDVVLLEAGDRVGADLDVVSTGGLSLDESLVTGESGAVARAVGDRLMAGTFVVQGDATCVVAGIGTATTLAGISRLADEAERPPSPLTNQLNRLVRIVAVLAASTGASLGVAALGLGLPATDAFLFGVGVGVALVPEGMLPTVTLSLARGAQSMASRNALVRRLDAVETLGATTFICTDKTGTLTQNRMNVVEVVTPAGAVTVTGDGYRPEATLTGSDAAVEFVPAVARAAVACVTGRVADQTDAGQGWRAVGDPMDAALHCLALRSGVETPAEDVERRPFTADRMLTTALERSGEVSVLGAPEAVVPRCVPEGVPSGLEADLVRLTSAGRRVLAVARREWSGEGDPETGLHLLGLVALVDPPRPDVREALAACRAADIRVAMITGDHPRTAEAIAREVGLLRDDGVVITGDELPEADEELAALIDRPGGAVLARVTPRDKLRIAASLRGRGHVVAMTGDGVNDAPALREADVGVAMGASGSDVARESADLVLLDDHFATIVGAIELGRATFRNIRRFLTYHLTDNVAELAPFAVWALSGGNYPLAIGVLQVLALDIGTDMLPALALGAEPPRADVMTGRPHRALVGRSLLVRALAVLGLTEAVMALGVCTVVLLAGGWSWGATPASELMLVASGSTFAAIAFGQMANAFACRSSVLPVWRLSVSSNPLVLAAVGAELVLLVVFLGVPGVAHLLGGGWPSALGWTGAAATAVVLVGVDAGVKRVRHRAGGTLVSGKQVLAP